MSDRLRPMPATGSMDAPAPDRPSPDGPLLACRGLVKRFGSVTALDGATLEVRPGSLTALLGPSGCGKTTLLRLIAGFETPDEGEIELQGRVISSPSRSVPPEKRRIAMVFQDFALFPHMDVAANVAFGLPKGSRRRERVQELLALVRLDGLDRRMPHELSGGQQQRVAVARALAAEPELILMDEPFSNLDPSVRGEVRDEVRHLLRQTGITAIVVTHDQEEALSLAGEIAVMMGGRVLQSGTPSEVYRAPATRTVGEFLGQANVLPGHCAGSTLTCALGTFEVDPPGDGDGDVDSDVDAVFRAETLELAEGDLTAGDGVGGEVIDVDYYGHDQMVTIRLDSGEVVRVRVLARAIYEVGRQVTVRATVAPLVFQRSV